MEATKPVFFDEVFKALKAGKGAKRPDWPTPMKIGKVPEDQKKDDLIMDGPFGPARVGLHSQDILATDWIII